VELFVLQTFDHKKLPKVLREKATNFSATICLPTGREPINVIHALKNVQNISKLLLDKILDHEFRERVHNTAMMSDNIKQIWQEEVTLLEISNHMSAGVYFNGNSYTCYVTHQ
jgi:hypothetical protein